MRIGFYAVIICLGLTSASWASVSIIEDYNGDGQAPIVAPKNTHVIEPATLDNDYTSEDAAPEIPLKMPAPQPGLLKQTALLVGQGLYTFGNYTLRTTAGSAVAYYYGQPANVIFSNTAYSIAMYSSGSTLIANFVYVFGMTTCFSLTSAIVFYAGYKSPDIVYYSGKTVYKTVVLTGPVAKMLLDKTQRTAKSIMALFQNEKTRDEMIEMVMLNLPEPIK